jgi:putative membrane protein insertion efficiency factor
MSEPLSSTLVNPRLLASRAAARVERTDEPFRAVARVVRAIPNAPLQGTLGRRIKDNPPYLGNLKPNRNQDEFIGSETKNPFGFGSPHRPGFFAALRMTKMRIVETFSHFPVRSALVLIAVYQRTLSPVLPVLFGPGCGCRFTPTCSHYAAGALRTHGFFAGLFLAARRLVKCTPLHPGGHDPVPPPPRLWRTSPPRRRPACLQVERVSAAAFGPVDFNASACAHRPAQGLELVETAEATADRFGASWGQAAPPSFVDANDGRRRPPRRVTLKYEVQ